MLGLSHEAGGTIGRNLEEPTASCAVAAPSSVAVRGGWDGLRGDEKVKWLVSVTLPAMSSAHVAMSPASGVCDAKQPRSEIA